jgi:drug/metabolite transporter (DMT)-like permease
MADSAVPRAGTTAATVLGFLAIACWSTTIAFTRTATEYLGPVTAGATVFLLAGIAGCVWLALGREGLGAALDLPPAYLLGCGGLFVLYEVCLCLAVGLAGTRTQTLEVGVINYLWPGLTLVLSVSILKRQARVWLVFGIMIAFTGVLLAMSRDRPLSWSGLAEGFMAAPAPYLLALGAAVSWGLYSTLSRKWAGHVDSTGVPLFFVATGLAFCLIRFAMPEKPHWSLPALRDVAFLALVPNLLGYTCWDLAMRKGRIVLVAAFSYLTPILAILFACLYLKTWPGASLWIACAMVVVGAVLCKLSISGD